MATLLVVLPTTAFFLTLLFDYWSLMRIDNQLKLITYQVSGMLNNAPDLSTTEAAQSEMSESDRALLASFCPSSMAQTTFVRIGDMPPGQTQVTGRVVYNRLNHMGEKQLQSTLRSYSYHDQNGSFLFECQ
jgi:hypothetical protein